jgi:hypothetical protein
MDLKMPVLHQHFPEVSDLLEVRTPDKNIRYWLNRRYSVALEPRAIAALFLPALGSYSLPEGQRRLIDTDLDILGYEETSRSALIHIRNTPDCFLCSFDPETEGFTSQPVPLNDMLNFIGSRQFLRSVQRSIEVVARAARWLENAR